MKQSFFLYIQLNRESKLRVLAKWCKQSTHEEYNYGQKGKQERSEEQIPTTLTTTKPL